MTVSSTVNKIIYTGTGATDTFVYPFSIYVKTDLVLTEVVIASGLETELTVDADYTVEVDGDGNFTGNVILLSGNLPATKKLVVLRNLPLTQEADYTRHGPLPAETTEQVLDRGIMIDQQLQEQIDRCIKISVSSTEDPTADELMLEIQTAVDAAALSETNAGASEDAAAISETNAAASAAIALAAQQALNLPTLGAGDVKKKLRVNAAFDGYELVNGDTLDDADGDTKIRMEEAADEDKIRFYTAGVQRALIDASGLALAAGADINEFSIDGTLAGNSDDAVPTEKAVKTYVDTRLALGAWASKTIDTIYQAAETGFVASYMQIDNGDDVLLQTDGSTPPTTARQQVYTGSGTTAFNGSVFCIVKKNDYYRLLLNAGAVTPAGYYFIPLG